jgi:hypothetical protein
VLRLGVRLSKGQKKILPGERPARFSANVRQQFRRTTATQLSPSPFDQHSGLASSLYAIVSGLESSGVVFAFVALIGYLMSSSIQWVELDRGTIRARRLLTRKLVEQPIADIVDARPLHSQAMGPLENALMDALLKTTNRGYEIRFKDGTKLGLVRGEMRGLDRFLWALAVELAKLREGDGIR